MGLPVLQLDQDGNGKGEFRSLDCSFKFLVEPTRDGAEFSDTPSHRVFLVTDGQPFEAGAMWMKRIERGERAGRQFFSITVDDPSFPAPLNFAAFPTEDQGVFAIRWSRPRQPARSAQAEQAA